MLFSPITVLFSPCIRISSFFFSYKHKTKIRFLLFLQVIWIQWLIIIQSIKSTERMTHIRLVMGKMGMRPDYATIVYCNLIRQTYKKTPIIIGGIEASLRRMSHYDYWSDKMKHSILIDSGADIILRNGRTFYCRDSRGA